MRRWVALCTALLMTIGLVTVTASPATAVGNPDPASAEVIAPNDQRVTYSTRRALSTPTSACAEDQPTAWFTLTPTASGYRELSANNAYAIDVYTGTADNLSRYGCGSDVAVGQGSRRATRLLVDMDAGTTYFIALNVGPVRPGTLTIKPMDDPVGAASIPLGDSPGAPRFNTDGIWVTRELDVRDRVEYSLHVDAADAPRIPLTASRLVRGSRVCSAKPEPVDATVISPSGEGFVVDYEVPTRFDHGHPCDADGQMDGGTYAVRLDARRTPSSDWVRTKLTDVDVTGPIDQLRATTSRIGADTVIDYPYAQNRTSLKTEVEELWTDGQWRMAASRVVDVRDVVAEFSADAGTTWNQRPVELNANSWTSGRDVDGVIYPSKSGWWRLMVRGQADDPIGDYVEVLSPLDKLSIEPVQVNEDRIIRGQNAWFSTKVFQKYSDGVWRGARGTPVALQFRMSGTTRWVTVDRGRVSRTNSGGYGKSMKVLASGDWRVEVAGRVSRPTFVRASNGSPRGIGVDPPPTIRIGDPFVVPACLFNNWRACMQGKTLLLQYRTSNGWQTLDRERSGMAGLVKLRAPAGRAGAYRVFSPAAGLQRIWRYG